MNVIAPVRRTLFDLFTKGRDVVLSDGENEITVWIQKLNNSEKDECQQAANKAKVKIQILAKDSIPDDDERKAPFIELIQAAERETLLSIILEKELQQSRLSSIEKVATEEKWSKDDYLTSLQDIWNDEEAKTAEKFIDNDPEAVEIYNVLLEYTKEVDEDFKDAEYALKEELALFTDAELQKQALEKLFETACNEAWTQEYIRQQIWRCVRDPANHIELLLSSPDDLTKLSDETLAELLSNYIDVEVDTQSAKG